MGDAIWISIVLFALSAYLARIFTRTRAMNRKRLALKHELMREAKLCVHCGYDVRSSNDRCPECGRRLGSSK